MTSRTALLLLDFQLGLGDQDWSAGAVSAARSALDAARQQGVFVVHSRVAFDDGYLDVSPSNKAFAPYKEKNLLPPSASKIVDELAPQDGEAVVLKNRFSPYSGSNLDVVLRSQQIDHLVLAGVTTSGVVLAAFTEGENNDRTLTVLSDACADTDTALHDTLMKSLFPRSSTVTTASDWVSSL